MATVNSGVFTGLLGKVGNEDADAKPLNDESLCSQNSVFFAASLTILPQSVKVTKVLLPFSQL